jgi:hypothetical protein
MENRATFLPFRDTMPGSVMNKRELALPGVVAGAVNAITAPARSMETYVDDYGNVQSKFNAPQEAANVALNMMGGGMGASRGAPANALGMFVGPRSKSWNAEANARAVQMEKAGATPQAIWQETGNWKAPDAAWRQEISDKNAIAVPLEQMSWGAREDLKQKNSTSGPISEFLKHPELQKAYDGLVDFGNAKKRHVMRVYPENTGGSFNPEQELITVGMNTIGNKINRSLALHELQHAIQQKEGFAKGGSPEMFRQSTDFSSKALQDAAILDKTMRASNLSQLEALKRFEVLFGRKPEAGAFAALERVGTGKELDIARDAAREAEKLAKNPLESYRRLAGEAEARATQKRRNLTDEQRRAAFPERSYDVPINELIIRR